MLRRWLEHPLTRGRDLDDPKTTALRREIIRGKPFLRRIYLDWYAAIRAALPAGEGALLELGSGAGMLREVVPEALTSEVFHCGGVHLVADGRALPIASGALRAIVMVDVLHHVPDCGRFFAEAARCVRPGGAIVAIEPWVTPWSRVVYGRLHHEPFDPDRAEWTFPSSGPLSGANGALPWIVLVRDRERFEAEHRVWRIAHIRPMMPFAYLFSGGVSLRSLAPGWSYPAVRGLERLTTPWMNRLGMFALIVLERRDTVAP
jgi:SAM-dependent methyltransferase